MEETSKASIDDKLPPPSSLKDKRFSVPRQFNERRVVVRPYESFRERTSITSQIGSSTKRAIVFGYASLNADQGSQTTINETDENVAPIFSIYGQDPSSSNVTIEQPVGADADNFITSLTEKNKIQLKKFLEHTPPVENQYFIWIRDVGADKMTIVSIKTLENHLKNKKVQRVKWRHLSTERVSIYRYSLPALTYEKSKACGDCILRHKKICLIFIWLTFVLFLCVVVLLGSINHEESTHPFVHMRNATQ